MNKMSLIAASMAVLLSAGCDKVAGDQKSVSADEVAKILKENPKMIVDALQSYQEQQRIDAEKAANEALASHTAEINDATHAPFVGPKDAKVTVVEFFDFSCHYCKQLAPELEKIVSANSDVKFVFKPLAFLRPVSGYMAKAAFAANNQGKFLEFYTKLMAAEGNVTEDSVDATAKELGLDMDKYKADMESQEVKDAMAEISKLAQDIQVNGVPTVIINGKRANSGDLQKDIDANK